MTNIEKIADSIRKELKKSNIEFLGNTTASPKVLSSGNIVIDWITSIGGFPQGRLTEIFAPEQTGKTSMALGMIANAQKQGIPCVYIDLEHAISKPYAKTLGCKEDLLISQPDTAEEAFELMKAVVKKSTWNKPIFIVLDSVAALTPKSEMLGKGEGLASRARLLSIHLPVLTKYVNKYGAILICLNQIRNRIGIVFGNPEYTPGGHALEHYISLRLEVKRSRWTVINGKRVGHICNIRCTKNKMGLPYRKAWVEFRLNKGFGGLLSVVACAVEEGIILKKGSQYTFGDIVTKGINSMARKIKETQGAYNALIKEIRKFTISGNGGLALQARPKGGEVRGAAK